MEGSKSIEDLGKAFEERMKSSKHDKPSNKVLRKREQAKRKKAANAKKVRDLGMLSPEDANLPRYCTLKTLTFHTLLKQMGDLVDKWMQDAKNGLIVNPGNPVAHAISINVKKCATGLAEVLATTVKQINVDNEEGKREFEEANRTVPQEDIDGQSGQEE